MRRALRRTLPAVLAATLLAVGGCSGGGDDDGQGDGARESVEDPEAGGPGDDSTVGPGRDPDAPPAEVPGPCSLVDDAQAGEILGADVTGDEVESTVPGTEGVVTCQFTPDDPDLFAALDVQTSDAEGAGFDDVLDGFTAFADVEQEELDVAAADDADGAALLVESDDLLSSASAVVLRDNVLLVVTGSGDDLDEARRIATEATEVALA